MAKRGLINPLTKHTDDWSGDETYYAARAVEMADERALLRQQGWLSKLQKALKL